MQQQVISKTFYNLCIKKKKIQVFVPIPICSSKNPI